MPFGSRLSDSHGRHHIHPGLGHDPFGISGESTLLYNS